MIKLMYFPLLKGYLSTHFKIQIYANFLFIFQWFLLPHICEVSFHNAYRPSLNLFA